MRSWAILFPHLESLKGFLARDEKPVLPRTLDSWLAPPFLNEEGRDRRGLLKETLLPEKMDRVYYGVEFCQRLIPDHDDLSEAVHLVSEAGLGFSFVTPPVTDTGVEILTSRFAYLQDAVDSSREIEVIVNDWGTLELLRTRFRDLEPVFGRMMNKMVRDPRVAPYYDSPTAPREGLLAVQQSSVTNPLFHDSLTRWGVRRHEFDNLFQGINIEVEGKEIFVSVYIPYGYVATGRVCMPGSLNVPKTLKFTEYMGCRKECQEFTHELSNTRSTLSNRTMMLIQRGNTIFYPNTREMMESVLTGDTSRSVDRIVYQPGLPI